MFQLRDQLANIFLGQTKEIENIHKTLPIETGRCLELDLALSPPGDSQPRSVQHEQVIGAITNSDSLGDGDAVLRSDRVKKCALLARINDGICGDQLARQGLSRRIDLKLNSR